MAFFFPCKRKKLINALRKFDMDIKEGSNHTKAECIHNGHKTTIPRHKIIKREVVKSICKFLLEKDYKEQEILKLLR